MSLFNDDDDDDEVDSLPDLHRLFDAQDNTLSQQRWRSRICSVLNLVVDFSMKPATAAFEPDDASGQLVPILRVFGPLVRQGHCEPHQSACLYIHGAFPYLMARPVPAGCDGRPDLLCPWNSESAVQRMIPGLTEALEAAMVDTKSTLRKKNIRKVTVLRGRGFYTYCDGPVAPFLRVEYYDPADRYSVRRALQNGLQDLAVSVYHPASEEGQQDDDDPVLKFHCFEAHLPYTMQFFKDWNLSGMSYIHMDACQLREPLPRQQQQHVSSDAMFLHDNTPDSLRQLQWKKETSCTLEVDMDVSAILNVLDVMTETPDDDDTVHWRAVPSLREIWMQEKRRMAKLLDPAHDFLNYPPSPQETRSHSKPGAQLAVQGMKELVTLTPGLDEEYQRAMTDIVQRHEVAITKRYATTTSDSPSDEQALEALDTLMDLTPSHSQTVNALAGMGDDNDDGYITDPPSEEESPGSAKEEHLRSSYSSSQEQGRSYSSYHQQSQFLSCYESSSSQKFESLSQSFHARGHIDDALLDMDEEELTQRVDRGDGIVNMGPYFETIDDVIDPKTLLPFDHLDDEGGDEGEDVDEEEFEQQLATMATQTLPSTENSGSQINNDACSDDDDASSIDSFELLARGADVGSPKTANTTTPPCQDIVKDGNGVGNNNDNNSHEWQHEADTWISPLKRPPMRKELSGPTRQTKLYPTPAIGEIPSWISHIKNHQTTSARGEGGKRKPINYFPSIGSNGQSVRPVRPPPSYSTVRSWWKRKQKADEKNAAKNSGNKKKSRFKDTASALRIDENSRKLVAAGRPEETTASYGVEEVVLESRVGDHLSQTEQEEESAVTTHVQARVDEKVVAASTAPESTEMSSSAPSQFGTPSPDRALVGMANQGGRLVVEKGGELKAKTKITQLTQRKTKLDSGDGLSDSLSFPVKLFVAEIFVHCRTGKAGLQDSSVIALTPDPRKDRVLSICYIFARDPGGGESIEYIERGCLFVPTQRELESHDGVDVQSILKTNETSIRQSLPRTTLGATSPAAVECLSDERRLLLRFTSIVRLKDPDVMLSWDPQSGGIGYLIERGAALGQQSEQGDGALDMVRLLGRNPAAGKAQERKWGASHFDNEGKLPDVSASGRKPDENIPTKTQWKGSGLGADWDEQKGPGAAAASIQGRLILSGWKVVSEEVKHANSSYLPAVMSSVLNRRIPFHNNIKLGKWYGLYDGRERWRVLHHSLVLSVSTLQLLDALDIVGRSGEAARLSGVEFSQSFPGIRGSQYKVEGVLLRALQSLNSNERGSKKGAKSQTQAPKSASHTSEDNSQSQSPWKRRRLGLPKSQILHREELNTQEDYVDARSYFFFSPSLKEATKGEALETQALTLEPKSGHQSSPVVVCDFTALYPSLVIAYNLCYSTCSGKLEYHSTRSEMRMKGRTTGMVGPVVYPEKRTASVLKHHVQSLEGSELTGDRAYVSPNGVTFVSETVVKGVLPQVLHEMLSTRAMLKRASKQYKSLVKDVPSAILRQLEARQLALKYVANVTYGYTSANYSGRCPMPLLADTIVECGRRTLSKAINTANEWGQEVGGRWSGCHVIYGDTDSIFVHMPGRTVEEAFEFGKEFCKAVSRSNPPPVQLKLEKVYLGSMMQTKKKYCGMKYDSCEQKEPTFEAKGIETIRRDQCALTQKVLRNLLITLFQRGIAEAKAYLTRQWHAIISDSLPVSEFVLTGRVKSRYKNGKSGPVQASLARRLAEADPGYNVKQKRRQPYVIVSAPGLAFKLKDCVLTPMELLEQWDAYSVHAGYYIDRHVNAAVQRCLGLAPYFIDVSQWFKECTKPRRRVHYWYISKSRGNTAMISNFFGSDKCSICGNKCASTGRSRASICRDCHANQIGTVQVAMSRLSDAQKQAKKSAEKCSNCNLCFESADTFAAPGKRKSSASSSSSSHHPLSYFLETPVANCICIDCPNTYERHRAAERCLEAAVLVETLNFT